MQTTTKSVTLTTKCLTWRYLPFALDGASRPTMTSVRTLLSRGPPSRQCYRYSRRGGSLGLSSLSEVFPAVASLPAEYTTENKRVGTMKVGGETYGMIFPRLRASTIESSADIIVQVRPEGKADSYSSHPSGRPPGRNGPPERI